MPPQDRSKRKFSMNAKLWRSVLQLVRCAVLLRTSSTEVGSCNMTNNPGNDNRCILQLNAECMACPCRGRQRPALHCSFDLPLPIALVVQGYSAPSDLFLLGMHSVMPSAGDEETGHGSVRNELCLLLSVQYRFFVAAMGNDGIHTGWAVFWHRGPVCCVHLSMLSRLPIPDFLCLRLRLRTGNGFAWLCAGYISCFCVWH
jgi:hypothetical protein|mmetsp:Transcript_5426/g.9822  ORF Transcript_5426/g.9822 Transcript_5426/m.9822 type:complete len:201 (-) Transcript_5426:1035-1637(-)